MQNIIKISFRVCVKSFAKRFFPPSEYKDVLRIWCRLVSLIDSGVRRKFSWGGFRSAKIFLCIKIESMIRKNIKQAAIQYVNVVKQL